MSFVIFFYLCTNNSKLIHAYFPAPGSYDVEKVEKTVHQSSPAYSIGKKYKEKRPEDIPGIKINIKIVLKSTVN